MDRCHREYLGHWCQIRRSSLPPVKVTYHTDTGDWELVEDYRVASSGYRFNIAAGFRFDLASVPRLIWWAISPFELSLSAPLVHDFIYADDGEVPVGSVVPPRRFSRLECDRIFRAMMLAEGVPRWRRALAYWSVRWFGRRF